MKFLLKTHTNNEYWDADYLLLEIDDAGVRKLRADREACVAFLTPYDAHVGSVNLECGFPVECGSFNFENVPDAHYEEELENQGWTDLTAFLSSDCRPYWHEEARIECVMVKTYRGGDMYITALSKYSGDSLEVALPDELLNLAAAV